MASTLPKTGWLLANRGRLKALKHTWAIFVDVADKVSTHAVSPWTPSWSTNVGFGHHPQSHSASHVRLALQLVGKFWRCSSKLHQARFQTSIRPTWMFRFLLFVA